MKKIKKTFDKKLVRGAAVFALVAIVIQGIALLFMTPGGLGLVYPYILATKSDRIKTGDSSLGEYFSLHKEVEESGLVILSADLNVDSTYKLAADYLAFLGRVTDVSSVGIYLSNTQLRAISKASVEGDRETFSKSCNGKRDSKLFSDQLLSFLEKIYTMNTKLSPDNKLPVVGIKGYDDISDITSAITVELFTSVGGFSGEHVEITNAKTNEEYVKLFDKYRDTLAEIMGGRFEQFEEMYGAVANNTIEESYAVRNLSRYAPAGEGTVFLMMPDYMCKENSAFVEMARQVYGKVTVTNVVYTNCTTITDGEETPRSDVKLPAIFDGIRVVDAGKLSGFREYYERTVNSFGDDENSNKTDVVGDTGKITYFMIGGSGPVTFSADSKEKGDNTVLIAPGQ